MRIFMKTIFAVAVTWLSLCCAVSAQWNGGTTNSAGIISAINAAAIVPPLAVEDVDDVPLSGSVSSATPIVQADMQFYKSVTIEVTANASGNTVTFQTCDDTSIANCTANSTWVPIAGMTANATGSSGSSAGTTTTTVTIPTLYQFRKVGRFFQAIVTNFIGGTTAVVGNLHATPAQNVIMSPQIPAGSNNIGNEGGHTYTSIQTAVTASSANQANANAVAALGAQSGKTNYLSGVEFTAGGSTAGACVTATVAGLLGGTANYTFCAPTGVLLEATPLIMHFDPPLPGAGTNTAITATLPALGTGNTNATAVAHGFFQ